MIQINNWNDTLMAMEEILYFLREIDNKRATLSDQEWEELEDSVLTMDDSVWDVKTAFGHVYDSYRKEKRRRDSG